MKKLGQKIMQWIAEWLTKESPPSTSPLCDFNRLSYELRPADVLLVEGRTRVSNVIKTITQSTWTHSALYIGRIYDIRDPQLQQRVRMAYQGDLSEQLMVEALLGEGTIIAPLSKYRNDHLRICRPTGLEPEDVHKVVAHAIKHIGTDYDVRHLLDLARFFFPWAILPRRWRSSLFEHNAGSPTRTVCSSMLASAFNDVNFPILPFIDRDEDGSLRFFKRNPRLFTPKDFDYSPYFDIIKYPFLGLDDLGVYRRLPWCDDTILYNDNERAFVASTKVDDANCDEDETKLHDKRKGYQLKQAQSDLDETDQPIANSIREANQ
ncbi:MAG: YiiX/YebB-like N1pC/P60 family cysteine hydrolase [Candidatus Thiodiazotropha sp.]